MIKNKKGQGLSLNFLIVAILAVIALIIIALYFTGTLEKMFTKQQETFQLTSQERALAEQVCKTACAVQSSESYEHPAFPENIREKLSAEGKSATCLGLTGKSFTDCKDIGK